jgi:hypothetical protein
VRDDLQTVSNGDSNSGNGRDVLSNLPSTRPQRRSPKRDGARTTGPKATRATAAKAGGTGARSSGRAAAGAGSRAAAGRGAAAKRPDQRGANRGPVAAQGYQGQAADRTPIEPPSATEMMAAAVEAAGELAQFGVTVGERVLRSALRRLPRP